MCATFAQHASKTPFRGMLHSYKDIYSRLKRHKFNQQVSFLKFYNMKAVIETETGLSTLKVAIDFNQLVRDNFAEVCKAIAIRRNAFKELLTKMEADNDLNGSIINVIRKSYDESDTIINMCKELNFTPETAQYVINMPLDDLSALNKMDLKRLIENHTEQINRLLL